MGGGGVWGVCGVCVEGVCVCVYPLYIPLILKLHSQEWIKRMEIKLCTHSCCF